MTLHSKFEGLEEEKKKAIIAASIEEFSKNSYEKASTNTIVERAGISKGLLFYYFGSKKNLYLYIYDYILEFIYKYVLDNFDADITAAKSDIFEKIMRSSLIKIKMAHQYLEMYILLVNAMHINGDLQKEILERREKIYKRSMDWLLDGLDTSMFRKDINVDKAIELVMFSLDGVGGKYMEILKHIPAEELIGRFESLTVEYYEYIDILKRGILSP